MKKYMLAIVVLLLIVLGAYYLFDESQRSFVKTKASCESLKGQLESAKRQHDASSDEIVSLHKSVSESSSFLSKWRVYYQANKDNETLINRVAEKTGPRGSENSSDSVGLTTYLQSR